MNRKQYLKSALKRIGSELTTIALVALFATIAIWLSVFMSIFWFVATYAGILIFITLVYLIIDVRKSSIFTKG